MNADGINPDHPHVIIAYNVFRVKPGYDDDDVVPPS